MFTCKISTLIGYLTGQLGLGSTMALQYNKVFRNPEYDFQDYTVINTDTFY